MSSNNSGSIKSAGNNNFTTVTWLIFVNISISIYLDFQKIHLSSAGQKQYSNKHWFTFYWYLFTQVRLKDWYLFTLPTAFGRKMTFDSFPSAEIYCLFNLIDSDTIAMIQYFIIFWLIQQNIERLTIKTFTKEYAIEEYWKRIWSQQKPIQKLSSVKF